MLEALAVAAGGAVGSLGRWGIGRALTAACPGLPAGTFAANVVAGLIIGLVSGLNAANPMPAEVKSLLTVGLCGGLSTFSTFTNETFGLIEAGNVPAAVANIAANVAVCLVAVWAGTRLGGAPGSVWISGQGRSAFFLRPLFPANGAWRFGVVPSRLRS